MRITADASSFFLLPLLVLTLRFKLLPSYLSLGTAEYWRLALVMTAGITLSVFLREWAHGRLTRALGGKPRGFTLFLFGAADEPRASGKWRNILLYVGGITFSLGAGIILLALSYFTEIDGVPTTLSTSLFLLASLNLIFAGFQCLPALPLDGGRILLEIFAGRGKLTVATIWILYVATLVIAAAICFTGLWLVVSGRVTTGTWLVLIALTLAKAGLAESEYLRVRAQISGHPLSAFMNAAPVCVPASASSSDFTDEYLRRYPFRMFPVVDEAGILIGMRSRRSISMLRASPDNTIAPDIDAAEALDLMVQTGNPRRLVAQGGRLVGIVSYGSLFRRALLPEKNNSN